MTTIGCDVETYSAAPLFDVGAFPYFEHESTAPICLAWAEDDDEPDLFLPREANFEFYPDGDDWPWWVLGWENDPELMFSAWNIGFEYNAWPLFFPGSKTPPIERWIDTMAESQALGWPRALGQTAEAMGLDADKQKDKRGKYLIQKLCVPQKTPKKDGGGFHRCLDETLLREMFDYCKQDVVAEREIAGKLRRL